MGCKCTKEQALEKLSQIESNDRTNNELNNNGQSDPINKDTPKDNRIMSINKTNLPTDNSYAKEIILIINEIRANPKEFAEVILQKKENIIEERDKKVYKQKVKVALYRGIEGFDEAAGIIKDLEPLPPLILNEDISIPFPEDEEMAKNKYYLEQEVRKIEEEHNINIGIFYKELVKIPEVSALLMVVDDNGKNAGKKRNALLSSAYKYIGISSRFYNKTFIAYFTFAE
ncbi:MAG: hypothetical protein MJ252_19830 [archaeon]|nr:hypothetical protein [archaeon]